MKSAYRVKMIVEAVKEITYAVIIYHFILNRHYVLFAENIACRTLLKIDRK